MKALLLTIALIVAAVGILPPAIAQSVSAQQEQKPIKISFQAPQGAGEALRITSKNSLLAAAPPQSDLQVSLNVSYNKETKKLVLQGTVVNLGPDPSASEGRVVYLHAITSNPHECDGIPNCVSSEAGQDLKTGVVPALPVTAPTGAGADKKFSSVYLISAEMARLPNEKRTNVYSFYLSVSTGKSDPNPKNNQVRVDVYASNIGRGQ